MTGTVVAQAPAVVELVETFFSASYFNFQSIVCFIDVILTINVTMRGLKRKIANVKEVFLL